MTTTITLNLTQEQLELILVANSRLLTYCYAQRNHGNDYTATAITGLVDINHQIVTRLQILKGGTIYNQHPQLAPRCRAGMPLDAQPAAQDTEPGDDPSC